ncbi:MAG: ABC transporter substrate-binding protein [Desulfuromonadales bacterium]|nr:MAG: ABC transporter substrate-binding protein [Desulfuromonadales bacterium]
MAMRRLICTALFALTVLCASSSLGAGKLVGVVLTSDMSRYKDAYRAFVKGLAAQGFEQGLVEIVSQTPNPDSISWANSVRKLNAIKPDLIVTFGAPATLVAIQDTSSIPIVFADVYGPVEMQISRSMSRTGDNHCGISSKVPMATLVKSMTAIRPVKTLGILFNSREAGSLVQLKELKRLAAQQGFAVREANVSSSSGLDAALEFLLTKSDCLFVSESSVVGRSLDKIVRKAGDARVPVISLIPDAAERGALVTLEVSPADQGALAADYAAKILSGKKPGELPVMTPRKVDFIINLSAAKALGLHVPFRVLSDATKVLK